MSGMILVAEDENLLRECICECLEMEGFSVLGAANGLAALELFRLHPDEIEVVVMDIFMPIMDGLTAIHEMRKIRGEVKVIVSTGSVGAQQLGILESGGPFGYLRKPYPLSELVSMVRMVQRDGVLSAAASPAAAAAGGLETGGLR